MSPRFDTLAIARDLRNHGFSQDQAEALAGVVNQAVGLPDLSVLATKEDLAALATATKSNIATLATKDELRAAIADVRAAIADVRTDIGDVKSDILKWITGLIVSAVTVNVLAIVGTMLALIKMLGPLK